MVVFEVSGSLTLSPLLCFTICEVTWGIPPPPPALQDDLDMVDKGHPPLGKRKSANTSSSESIPKNDLFERAVAISTCQPTAFERRAIFIDTCCLFSKR